MAICAHTRSDRPHDEWELLEIHAKAVADLAESFCKGFAPGFGQALGLLHDAGKYQPAFQKYLLRDSEAYDESKSSGVPHSIVGEWFAAKTCTARVGQLLAWPIAAHHGALRDKAALGARLQTANRLLENSVLGGMLIDALGGMLPQHPPLWANGWEAFSLGIRMPTHGTNWLTNNFWNALDSLVMSPQDQPQPHTTMKIVDCHDAQGNPCS